MRNYFTASLLAALAVIVEVSVLPLHADPHFKPDLLLLAMVFLALRGTRAADALPAWLLGCVKDVFSGLYLGLNAFSFLIIFIIIKSISDILYAESAELFIVTATAASLGCVTINLLLLVMLTSSPGIAYSVAVGLLPHLLSNAFAASLLTLFPLFAYPRQERA